MHFRHNIFFVPPVFLFLFIILSVIFFFVLPEYNVIPFPFNFSGIIFIIAGLVFASKTYDQFRKFKTTISIEESTSIITTGIFSISRNPMYAGMTLVLAGIGICMMNLYSILTPFLFWAYINFIIIPKEEKLMFKVFGKTYSDYKSKVRRWI